MPDLSQYGNVSAAPADFSRYGTVSAPIPAAAEKGNPAFEAAAGALTPVIGKTGAEIAAGGATGLAHTLLGAYKLIRMIPGVGDKLPEPSAFVESLGNAPESLAGKVGHYGEQAAEFIIPETKIAKATEGANLLLRMAAHGAGAGVVAGTQTGGDATASATATALGAVGVPAGDALAWLGGRIAAGNIPKIPDMASDAVGFFHPPIASGARVYNKIAGKANRVISALRDAPAGVPAAAAEVPAEAAEVPAVGIAEAAPPSQIVKPGSSQSFDSRRAAIPSEHGLLPPIERSQFFRPLAESGAADLSGYGSVSTAPTPDVPPAPAIAEPPAAATAETPTPAQIAPSRVEDAADAQDAWEKSRDESREWANRAARADRFAAYLTREGVEPTRVNLVRAAKEMAEAGGPPSAETVDMIHDRMNYQPQAAEDATRSRLTEALTPSEPAAAPAEKTELEQQLQASVDAVTKAKGKPARRAAINKAVKSIGDLGRLK